MTTDSWIALGVLVVMVGVLITDRFPSVLVLGSAVMALLFTDVIEVDTALIGLSSPAPATIAALYVVAGAATATGAFVGLIDWLLQRRPSVPLLATGTAALSALIPNTPLIAMFAPRVVRWAHRTGGSASRFLLPMSFASILGGVITIIGTSTNLVVSDLLVVAGEEPLGMFEITVVGLPVAIVGVIVLSTIGRRLLPDRTQAIDPGARARTFQIAMRVDPASQLVDQTIASAGLRDLEGAFLAFIEREDDHGVVNVIPASPSTVLLADDLCCFVGESDRVLELHGHEGLVAAEVGHLADAARVDMRVFEAVVAPASQLAGSTLRAAGFRGRYGGAVVAIHRADGEIEGQIGRERLRAGDVLLVLADESFGPRWRGHQDFSLVAALDQPAPFRERKAWLVYAGVLGLVACVTADLLGLFEAAVAAAALVLVGGAIGRREAVRSIDLNVVLTMAAAISLGAGVAASGLAGEVAGLAGAVTGTALGDVAAVAGIMIVTILLTEVLTNTAAAALMVPVALTVGVDNGVEPRMLAVAVLIGASCSFLSPIGYQTNLMVYGLGGYRFTDFTRVGAPLTLATIIVTCAILPFAFG